MQCRHGRYIRDSSADKTIGCDTKEDFSRSTESNGCCESALLLSASAKAGIVLATSDDRRASSMACVDGHARYH